jgi:hypothetical protein
LFCNLKGSYSRYVRVACGWNTEARKETFAQQSRYYTKTYRKINATPLSAEDG